MLLTLPKRIPNKTEEALPNDYFGHLTEVLLLQVQEFSQGMIISKYYISGTESITIINPSYGPKRHKLINKS